MADIKCPVCGEVNSDTQEFCQYCQSRLQPLTGALKGADAPIQPGEAPTKKITAELEPILPQWLREARERARKTSKDESDLDAQVPQSGNQGATLLAGLQSQAGQEEEEETPDWLANITGVTTKKKPGDSQPGDIHWVELGEPEDFPVENTPGISATQSPSDSSDEANLPAWLSELQSPPMPGSDELSDWSSRTQSEKPMENMQAFSEAGLGESDALDPLGKSPAPSDTISNVPAGEEAAEIELPDWLKAVAPESLFDHPEPGSETGSAGLPNWLKAATTEPPTSEIEPAPAPNAPALAEQPPSPAFTESPLAANEMDALFTEMPDWLSRAGEDEATADETAETAKGQKSIPAAELPSWVQAMRPVESTITQSTQADDQSLESHGALSGLSGVLPDLPEAAPMGKPRAYPIKLLASQEQQAHAALLINILDEENKPAPISSTRTLRSQRSLSRMIAALLFLLLSGVLLGGTQLFRLPAGWPAATVAALQVVEAFPENSPVLVVVDYEPARMGEMESASAPLLDHMILLRHPTLTFMSTSPTGALLAENLMTGVLGGHNYQRGAQYFNLGYLPGGSAGVLAFAQNPPAAKPFDLQNEAAWVSGPLQGVNSLSNFAGLIVLTDSSDSARAWIEQAGLYRGSSPLVVVSSAQSAPMIQPYFKSGQISGLVNGLYGGSILEQNNAGRPGQARVFWDAYSLGLICAAILMTGGGLWSLTSWMRGRAAGTGV